MRPFLLIGFLALVSSAAYARDLLTERNGGELAVKMVKIIPTEAKYCRTDNPDGPL